MDFDQRTVSLLTLRPDAPVMTDEQASALQDAHLAHIADLIEQGQLLAAGPTMGPEAGAIRGISIWSVDAGTAAQLCAEDPAVLAGRLTNQILTWMVPAGQVGFEAVPVPRSMAEATGP